MIKPAGIWNIAYEKKYNTDIVLISYELIEKSNTIGISSGASAPEKLVQTLLDNIKKNRKVSIEEVVVAEEKVVFKLPKELYWWLFTQS